MKTVIEHGYRVYTTTCDTCNCHFSYELSDIERGVVTCPDCGNMCAHHTFRYDVTSRLKDRRGNNENE